jgi:hypothetical protein
MSLAGESTGPLQPLILDPSLALGSPRPAGSPETHFQEQKP